MHFCNNAATRLKPAKYADMPPRGVRMEDFARYDAEFDALFADFRQDYLRAADRTMEQVCALLSERYEQFQYVSCADGTAHTVAQYPTYSLGCYLFGSIDRAFGKDALLDVLKRPERIRDCYNRAIAGVGPAL